MNHFSYKNNQLFCEDVPVMRIAEQVGTPCYIYSCATLKRHFKIFSDAFEGVDRLVCYSAKANTNLAVLALFAKLGGGLDIVSRGELYRGLKAGFPPDRIVYSGVGKRTDEIDEAIGAGILMFNVESIEELKAIGARAESLGMDANISFRVNPDVDPKTHPYISTGLKKNKFGLDKEAALEGYRLAMRMPRVKILGIDCHIGSQLTEIGPFSDALENLMALVGRMREMGVDLKYVDVGGGLGIRYDQESPPDPGRYAEAIVGKIKESGLKLILEPGRVIVGNAGILLTRILYTKPGPQKKFVITDAAMTDLIRPTLYQAFHRIVPVKDKEGRPEIVADIVGPVCESGDFLAKDRIMGDVSSGEHLAVFSAGAYGFVMSSNYCSRPRAAEVMVSGQDFAVIKERETVEDLVKGESVPNFI